MKHSYPSIPQEIISNFCKYGCQREVEVEPVTLSLIPSRLARGILSNVYQAGTTMDAQLLDETKSEAELEEDELIDHVPGDKGASDQRTEPDLNWSYEDHFARSCEHGEQEEQHIESLDQAVQEDGRVKAHAAKDGPDGQQQQQPDSFWTGSMIRARAKTHQEAIQHLGNCVRKKEEKRTEGEHKLVCWFNMFLICT